MKKWPTAQEINNAKTPKGAWTRATLAKWGVPWPPPAGWRKALVDQDQAFFDFLATDTFKQLQKEQYQRAVAANPRARQGSGERKEWEMSNVVELDVITRLDIPAEKVLRGAIEVDLETVLVIGRKQDGELYFAGSSSDGGDALWLMALAKKELLA